MLYLTVSLLHSYITDTDTHTDTHTDTDTDTHTDTDTDTDQSVYIIIYYYFPARAMSSLIICYRLIIVVNK